MFSIKREFINWENGIVEVIKKCTTSRIKDLNGLKELLECDVVLRKHETTYFCRKIQDAELIEENILPENEANEITNEIKN